MGVSTRIRTFRVRAGKTREDMAKRLGIDIAWYTDIELRDDEFSATLTLFKAMELASLLGVTLAELAQGSPYAGEHIELLDLPQRIRSHVERGATTMQELGARAGGTIDTILESPVQALAEIPIDILRAVVDAIGINWLALVTEEPAA